MDIISLGLDLNSFSPEKLQRLNEFLLVFERLDKYDGKTISPIMGAGLVEFNNAITAQSKLLDDLNSKIVALNSTTNIATNSTAKAAKGTKELTEEEARLKVQTQENNKALLDQAKSQNVNVQARVNAKKLAKEQYDAETALASQQKADSALITAMIKKQADAETASAAQQKKDSAAIVALKKQQQQAIEANIRAQQRESVATKVLTDDYALLKQAQQEQSVRYTNLYINKGPGSQATKDALSDYTRTSAVVNELDKNLIKAGKSTTGLGVQLTHALGYLRNLAYILPGIGLAGIFNLAFEAISKAAESLGIFDNKQDNIKLQQIGVNKEFKEFIDILKQVDEAYKSILNPTISGVQTFKSKEDELKFAEAGQKSTLTKLELEKSLIISRAIEAQQSFNAQAGFEKETAARGKMLAIESQLAQLREAAGEADAKFNDRNDPDYKNPYQKDIDLSKSNLDLAVRNYNDIKKINEDNSRLNQDLSAKEIEIAEYKAEQIRKIALETSKIESQSVINKNDFILGNEISTMIERLNALKRIEQATISANEAQKKYILDRPDAFNIDFDGVKTQTTETQVAIKQANEATTEAIRKQQDDSFKLIEAYRQRRLTATLQINKNEVDEDAIKNEKIANNETNSLDQRLNSYVIYLTKKQVLDDLEFQRAIDTLALKSKDPTALLEIERLKSDRETQKANKQADAEKRVYDIVYSSLQKELKAVIDENEVESFVTKEAHIQALHEINEHYEKRLISYRKYKLQKENIDIKYQKKDLDEAIIQDDESILRLEVQLDKELRLKEKYDKEAARLKDELEFKKLTGGASLEDEKSYNVAAGEQKGVDQAIEDTNKKLNEAQIKRRNDRLKREQLTEKDSLKLRNEWIDAALRVEKALYEAIKEIVDAGYEYRVQQVEKQKRLIDEQYGYEIDAINKSSLSAKDKAALDIQLQAQKQVLDNNAILEERRIKVEQAEFDKKLAIANATIGIIAAIIRDGLTTPKAIADAAIGAIEIVKIAATPIPNYEEGTVFHPGGKARIGESGIELVKEPYRSPWLVYRETVQDLPVGTQVIPITDHPEFGGSVANDGWAQTKWLGKQIRRIGQQKIVTKNIINIDLGFETYKRKQLHGK